MKRTGSILLILMIAGTACQPLSGIQPVSTPEPVLAWTATPVVTVAATPTQTPTPLPGGYPAQGYGPTTFPESVNPLTGLEASEPALLERRPVISKVSNAPDNIRPQWGLSMADIVYEYYIEGGDTRFAAIFYGRDASQVGDIRSGRFFDENLIRMYKGIFAFGSADYRVRNHFSSTEYANRLMYEWEAGCPAMCRFQSGGFNFLLGNTAELSSYASQKEGLANTRQNLDGMFFQLQVPEGGAPVDTIYTRFSSATYSRWDYDTATARYLRFADTKDDFYNGRDETYAQLTDRLNTLPIAADTLVVLLIPHQYYSISPEIVEMSFENSGLAFAFRDGQAYQLKWQRPAPDSVVYLTYENGRLFPFKPGTTWFEVMGQTSEISQDEQGWRFVLKFP
ncbi:MAG: DUF3048 domain-containing protein [Anaerolineales bacterium]|nr:DUF3048 domain-containing protein [Anaerolineales bacterium]